ncbi:MAG: c-type cytochrome [Bradyrhizobium sp.]|uniref:c-type cytochrome n=1 Tax=Bradyrhizobium sp. TaxID=376 RepID=UPI00121030BD|nr:c-type cytochrome [Bradyrhizobium sp.]THD46616.1 MAG: c-type cytochrome [Bradyrhizobium sp.]
MRLAGFVWILAPAKHRAQSREGGNAAMLKGLFSLIFSAGVSFAMAALPACAADDIEAKVQLCAACHGQDGVPTDPKTIPIIWGQQQSYLVKQLHDFRSGDRDQAIMSPIAKGLAQDELRKIAAYFAAKGWPAQSAAAASAPPNGLAQCQPCHQPNFEGGPPAPRLAGLSYEYLAAAMRSFAAGERTNNGDMPKFMQALTDSERDAMARYLSAL